MLIKIGDTLGGWLPRAGGGDPLAVIRAAWTGLVGVEVARAAQPVAIANDTLVIITTSSSWSHQLAFLEPEIIRGIRAVQPTGSVARLRFRVGTIRSANRGTGRRPGGRAPAQPAARTAPTVTAPRDPQEALARFRATVERYRKAHVARGGQFCPSCAAPVDRRECCLPCTNWARAELEARCQRLLFDAPWLAPGDVLEMLPGLSATDYDLIRRRLLRTWWDEMALARKRASLPRPIAPDRSRLRKIASSYVLLETKMDPNRLELESPVRRNALGDLYDFIRSVEPNAQ